jgi:3-isopropylmalate/(R)-2-methylmalate dehydratase small subunit
VTPIRGRVWHFGDDVSTDVIHPPQFFSLAEDTVKRGLFHGLDPDLQPSLQPGDIFVAGRNFGCGSSRETSVRSLCLNGVGAIVALDFARIFFRSATNRGLPCLTFRDPRDRARLAHGERVELAPAQAQLTTAAGERIELEPPGEFVLRIWAAGGLLALLPQAKLPGR